MTVTGRAGRWVGSRQRAYRPAKARVAQRRRGEPAGGPVRAAVRQVMTAQPASRVEPQFVGAPLAAPQLGILSPHGDHETVVEERIQAAKVGQVEVLRISFVKVLEMVQGLWRFLQCAEDVLTEKQVRLIVRRAMRELAEELVPRRRQRACPRKLRKPVSGWPRLLRNTYTNGPVQYELRSITAENPKRHCI